MVAKKRVNRGDILCTYAEEDPDFKAYYIFINALPNGTYNLVEIDSDGSAIKLVQLKKELLNFPHTLPPSLENLI